MEDNLLNRASEKSDNSVYPVQNKTVALFSSLPILILIICICKNKGKGSHYYRYEGVVFEETMLVKVLGFTDDAKKRAYTF